MSRLVEHHANIVLSSFLPGSWPNPMKLISMRDFFFTNGKTAVRDNPSAELCVTSKHDCQFFFSCGEMGNLLLLTPTEKVTALFSGSATPGRQQQRGLDYHHYDGDDSLGTLY